MGWFDGINQAAESVKQGAEWAQQKGAEAGAKAGEMAKAGDMVKDYSENQAKCPKGTLWNPKTETCHDVMGKVTTAVEKVGNTAMDAVEAARNSQAALEAAEKVGNKARDVVEMSTEVWDKQSQCPKGTLYNPSTGACDDVWGNVTDAASSAAGAAKAAAAPVAVAYEQQMKCPQGTLWNPKSEKCEESKVYGWFSNVSDKFKEKEK